MEQNKKKVSLPLLGLSEESIDALLKAGVHFGHKTQKWHPSMRDYIYTTRNGIHIIDLIKTIQSLNDALESLYEYASKGEVMFVGTKPQLRDLVKDAAIRSRSHFVVNRWPGGLLTNYMVTRKSLKKMNDYVKAFHEGIENRTKKELMLMRNELNRLKFLYEGVRSFNKKPACLVAVDAKKSLIAIREAHKMGIPVIAIVDTNSSTELVDHVIPANDDAISSVEFILKRIVDTILLANEGKGGVEYQEINMAEVDEAVRTMAKKLAERKLVMGEKGADGVGGKHRIVRVSKEQAKKFVK